jgi:anti-sigma B factor antagonist
MKFSIDKHEKYVVLKLKEAKLTTTIAPQLKSELTLINAEGQRNIVLDLSSVKEGDSSALSTLLFGHRLCQNAEGCFIVTGLCETIEGLVVISQLENTLTVVGSVDEAVDLIFMEEIEKELKKEVK